MSTRKKDWERVRNQANPTYPSLLLKQNFSRTILSDLGQVAPLASREAWEFGNTVVITELDQS